MTRLYRGQNTRIEISDGLRLDTSSKVSVWSSFRLSPDAADSADVVMSFPDAEVVDMSPADIIRHVEAAPAIATAERRSKAAVTRGWSGHSLLQIYALRRFILRL